MSLYQKLQTCAQGMRTGKSKKQTEIVFGRKKSNKFCYKRSYLNGSGEFQKSKRKYNSVNVNPGDLSHDQVKSISNMKNKKLKSKKSPTTMMEKKLKVIVGPINSKKHQNNSKKRSKKRYKTESNFTKNNKKMMNQSNKVKTSVNRKTTKDILDSSENGSVSEAKVGTPLTHLNVIKKYIQLEKKFGIKSKSIGKDIFHFELMNRSGKK
jgi:hypothetical protein